MSRTGVRSKTAVKKSLEASMYREGTHIRANSQAVPTPWVRNPQWISTPTVLASEEKAVFLLAVYENYPHSPGIYVNTSDSSSYTVDWGDGTSGTFTDTAVAHKTYNYGSLTDNTVSISFGSNLVTLNSHGYTNNQRISFASSTVSDVEKHVRYYIVNSTTNTFQLALTEGGNPITIGTGTGVLFGFKQVAITVTGTNILQLRADTNSAAHNSSTDNNILEAKLCAPDATNLHVGSSGSAANYSLDRVEYIGTSNTSISLSSGYLSSYVLKSVVGLENYPISDLASAFFHCNSLEEVPDIAMSSGASTNLGNAFYYAINLVKPPKITNIPNQASIGGILQSARRLPKPPEFEFSSGGPNNIATAFAGTGRMIGFPYLSSTARFTNTGSAFQERFSDIRGRYYNTSLSTNNYAMFYYSTALRTVPQYDFSSTTGNSYQVFYYCGSLLGISRLDFSASLRADNIFGQASSLRRIKYPLDFSSCDRIYSAFSGDTRLEKIHSITTSSVLTNSNNTFNATYSLKEIPLFDTSEVTNMADFAYNSGLESFPAFNLTKVTNCYRMLYGTSCMTSPIELNLTAVTDCRQICYGSFSPSISITTGSSLGSASYAFHAAYALRKVKFHSPSCTDFSYGLIYAGNNGAGAATGFSDIDLSLPSCTNFAYAFRGNNGGSHLTYIPSFDMSSGTSITTTFYGNYRLRRMKATGINQSFNLADCELSSSGLNEVYTNLADLTGLSGKTITVSRNPGVSYDTPTIATNKNWTVTG